ncbi:SUMF1/EgtB/PvdO family nonheme iron enzyme, partial [bacterium]|nr:SUMF1/EgtB/PvdO family nonheme iron enzyme [bacterium]
TTFAGSGPDSAGYGGFGGDGKAAAQARLYFPQGVAVDAKGVVYIADTKNDRVRRVGTDGIISTFAGTGEAGFSGDGGPATQARLYWPSCVAVDGSGVVYTADGYLSPLIIVKDPPRYGIQRVGVDGIISTFAGTGNVGSSGDGGPALQAKLSGYVNGVAVDASGNVYIADTWNHRIRRVGTDRIITTVAGSGPTEGGFSGDGGPATQARLNTPYGVFVDGSGIIYIADGRNHRIRRVGTDGIITTFAGSGPTGTDEGGYSGDGWPATQATLSSPRAVCADASGNLYIADYANHRVRRVGPDGVITTFTGTGGGSGGDGGLAVLAGLTAPSGVAVDAQGNLYIAETGAHRIRRVTAAEVSSASLSLSAPSLAFDSTRVGSTSQLTLTISNTGGGPLSITGIALSGPDTAAFRVSPSVVTIPAGQRQALTVTFAPTAAGPRSASLVVSHSAAGSPSRVSLSGTGYVGIGPVAPTADFDGSGEVGFDDFFLFASAFGQKATGDNTKFDLDKDGEVSFGDFFLFAADFGKTVQKSTKAITVNLPGGTTMEMVWIEPGKFTMGSPSSEVGRYDNEGPQREVTITKGFYLGKYELTQGQWQKVMGTAPWVEKNYVSVPAHPDNPAVFISWDDTQALLKKLNDAELGAGYRLPTEAEWEYAGRAGTTTRWSFGDDESRLKDYAWYGESTLNEFYVHKVGTKLPNPWGLCDMHGNVFEWVQDWYALYAIGAQTDPTGPDSGSVHVYRGGNFYFSARIMRSAYRVNGGSSYREGDLGLRLLRQGK